MFTIPRTVGAWLYGMLGAAIRAAAGCTGVIIVDPKDFNLESGLSKLGAVALWLGIVAAIDYLRTKPLPAWDGQTERRGLSATFKVPPELRG